MLVSLPSTYDLAASGPSRSGQPAATAHREPHDGALQADVGTMDAFTVVLLGRSLCNPVDGSGRRN
jgi:hypothetical protein